MAAYRLAKSQAWQNYLAWSTAICVESKQPWLLGALDTSATSKGLQRDDAAGAIDLLLNVEIVGGERDGLVRHRDAVRSTER
jgi:hypothetical protein